jgi:hypothetical protein
VIVDRGHVVAAGSPDGLTGAAVPTIRVTFARDLDGDERGRLAGRVEMVAPTARLVPGGEARVVRVTNAVPAAEVLASITAWAAEAGLGIVTIGTAAESLEERYLEILRGEAGP